MVFPAVMYGCESWTIKKAECQTVDAFVLFVCLFYFYLFIYLFFSVDAFELWCWRRLLRVPWTARRSNQSILKEISPGCSCWSWNSNTLATRRGELTHWKRPWYWERLRAGGEGDDRGWGGWMASLTQWTWVWVNSESWWWTGRPGMWWFMRSWRVGHDWATELNWTESPQLLKWYSYSWYFNWYFYTCSYNSETSQMIQPTFRSHHFMANRWRKSGNSDRLYFLGLQNCCRWWLQPRN